MDVSRYHKFLRVSAVIAAAVLVFDGGYLSPVTQQLSDTTINYLASVGSGSTGMYASVPVNDVNSLTAQLEERQRTLDAREAALREREIETRAFGTSGPDYSVYILSAILFILTVLIVLNYAMDFARARTVRYEKQVA